MEREIKEGQWVLCETAMHNLWGRPRKVVRTTDKAIFTELPRRNGEGSIEEWEPRKYLKKSVNFVADTEEAAHEVYKARWEMVLTFEKAVNEMKSKLWDEMYAPILELVKKNRAQS